MNDRSDGKVPFFTRIRTRSRHRLRLLASQLGCPQNEVIDRALELYERAARLARPTSSGRSS